MWIASNDRSRSFGGGKLSDGCLVELPATLAADKAADTIALIDVLWLDTEACAIEAAFEIEHTTSIYSGILRLCDLTFGASGNALEGVYLVAPDDREKEVRAQLQRPAFQGLSSLRMRYLPYGELERNRESMARFGEGLKAIDAVARILK